MSPNWIAGLSLAFVLGTIISCVIEGVYVGAEQMNVLNELCGYTTIGTGGLMEIMKLGAGFLTHGLPKVLLWDYAFFEGPFEIIRWFFIPLSIAVIWGMVQVFISVAQGLLSKFVG